MERQQKAVSLKSGRKSASSLSLMFFPLWEDWAKAIQNKTEMRDKTIRKEGRNSHSFRWHDFRDPATARKQSENIL